MIRHETIEKVLDVARIEEVIGDFVSLKKRGGNFIGNCPFHNEKTPSFAVSPAKGIYKCFGCGVSGNVFGFIMQHEHLSYPEAVKHVASRYKIEVEEEKPSAAEMAQIDERESLMAVTTFAAEWFQKQLFDTGAGQAIGLSYFNEREFRTDTIKKFGLGYSPESRDALTKQAIENGYKLEYLEKTGLTIVKENYQVDRFRGRVIFPIHNVAGRVIGFGARILGSDKSTAKYLNSPESDIYHKSSVLYGLFQARKAIADLDNCCLVEGYTDVISLHQSGINNVVASSGTSLTTDQIRMIRRYTQHITILYDGDAAGIKASFRGIDMILAADMTVRIVLFPDGEDPDSFARKHHPDEVKRFITENARDFILFKTQLLLDEASGDPIKRAALTGEMLESIALTPNALLRSEYLKECSRIMDVDEQTLTWELSKILRKNLKKGNEEAKALSDSTRITKPQEKEIQEIDRLLIHEENLIRVLVNYGNMSFEIKSANEDNAISVEKYPVAEFIINDLNADEYLFQSQVYQKMFDEIKEGLTNGNLPCDRYFINHPDNEIRVIATHLAADFYEISPLWETDKGMPTPTESDKISLLVKETLLKLKLRKAENLRKGILLGLSLPDITEENVLKVQVQLVQINEFIQALKNELGLSSR
ncbi:MAG TPA: DNA primase [Bacteroidales bacterium]|nr:MAG: DNA primase [Bacteroidetes bacterium GWE2_42_24]OFY27334.1 MAG: DNA primase [Bacteroidetes bacterium GWF2_43_11]HAQ65044.1 DNA primase [Bacteroidales bacterium]HBZ65920.1 DNA primase [Bacteroidales bacterium]